RIRAPQSRRKNRGPPLRPLHYRRNTVQVRRWLSHGEIPGEESVGSTQHSVLSKPTQKSGGDIVSRLPACHPEIIIVPQNVIPHGVRRARFHQRASSREEPCGSLRGSNSLPSTTLPSAGRRGPKLAPP